MIDKREHRPAQLRKQGVISERKKKLDVYSVLEYNSCMGSWEVVQTKQFERDFKRVTKSHPRESAQIMLNLQTYVERLERGNHPLLLAKECNFVHREQSGCQAITQQPLHCAAQIRLYLYAYVEGEKLYLICMGDKHTQAKDNAHCKKVVEQIRKETES